MLGAERDVGGLAARVLRKQARRRLGAQDAEHLG